MDTISSIDLNIIIANIFAVPLFLRNTGLCRKFFVTLYFLFFVVAYNISYSYYALFDLATIGKDFADIAQNVCLTVSYIGGDLKLFFVMFRLKEITAVTESVKRLVPKYVVNEKHRKIFNRSEIENKAILIIYSVVVGTTAILASAILIRDPTIGGRLFPYRVRLPELFSMEIRVAYWSSASILLALQIVAIDCLNVNVMNQLRCQLKLLNINLQELIDENDLPIDVVEKMLKNCIRHHQIILRLRKTIDDIFKFPVLMQFIISFLIIVMTGFEAVVLTESEGLLVVYFYCGCIFSQLFAYCWFANQAMEENKFLALAAYNTSWVSFGQRYSKMLLLLMMNSQKPFTFSVGGFFDLSLSSFTGIWSRSYSYIAVLRQVYTE